MPKINIRFTDGTQEEIFLYEYEESCTIEEMLEDYLRKTHSKMTLNPEEIMFIYKSRILNKERNLNNTLKEVFNFLMFFLFLYN